MWGRRAGEFVRRSVGLQFLFSVMATTAGCIPGPYLRELEWPGRMSDAFKPVEANCGWPHDGCIRVRPCAWWLALAVFPANTTQHAGAMVLLAWLWVCQPAEDQRMQAGVRFFFCSPGFAHWCWLCSARVLCGAGHGGRQPCRCWCN